jgi:eukaryotic-like serine/threonine-protein kinase
VAERQKNVSAGEANAVIGTMGYIAPECMLGAAASVQSDLYALGMMLFECISGRAPYSLGSDASSAATTVLEGMDLPTDLRQLILQLIAHDPQKRPSKAKEALQVLATGQINAGFATLGERVQKRRGVRAAGSDQTKTREA